MGQKNYSQLIKGLISRGITALGSLWELFYVSDPAPRVLRGQHNLFIKNVLSLERDSRFSGDYWQLFRRAHELCDRNIGSEGN